MPGSSIFVSCRQDGEVSSSTSRSLPFLGVSLPSLVLYILAPSSCGICKVRRDSLQPLSLSRDGASEADAAP